MSFKVEPKAGPTILTPTGSKQSARDRAIAKIMGSSAQVSDPTTQVSGPEDIARSQPKSEVESKNNSNNNNSEAQVITAPKSPTEAPSADPEAAQLKAQFALLARKEKALRIEREKNQAAIKDSEARFREMEQKLSQLESERQSKYIPKDNFKNKDKILETLKDLGLTYDDITAAAINSPQRGDVDNINRIRDQIREELRAEFQNELKPVKEAQERAIQEYEDRQNAQYEGAMNSLRSETKRLVSKDPAFEALASQGDTGVEEVIDLIQHTHAQGLGKMYPKGYIMSVEEACQLVEDELVERFYKASQISKVKSKFTQQSTETDAKAAPVSNQNQMTTLTNNSSSAPQLSRRERALLAGRGQLK